jgi:hypothetical protein
MIWKERVVTLFEALTRRGTELNHEYISEETQSQDQGMNPRAITNEARMLTIGPQRQFCVAV